MKSTAKNIDQYLDTLQEPDRLVFTSIRETAVEVLPQFRESMQYGFPMFEGDGKFAFSVQKNHVSLYFHHPKTHEVISKYTDTLGHYFLGKDTVRFHKSIDIDLQILKEALQEIFCPR